MPEDPHAVLKQTHPAMRILDNSAIVIQRQLGHTSLGVTSIYLQGIDSAEIIDAVHARRAPMIPVDASLRR